MLSQHQGRNYSNLSTWENNLKSEMLFLYATMNSHVDGNKSPKQKSCPEVKHKIDGMPIDP